MTDQKPLRGRILRATHHQDGTSHLILDNGPVRTITIVTFSEDLPALIGAGSHELHAHLLTRKPGHFRKKGGQRSEPTDV